jgi:hypothetical protein
MTMSRFVAEEGKDSPEFYLPWALDRFLPLLGEAADAAE